ncbi:TPA: hypothetical protein ACIZBK_002809 [Legionella pneumophila]|nr:hypothetical protein [Legionella pneumophila]HAU9927043.1 hypothetical protein [Legionella pneumophila]HAU9933646.1 hypothetical protein [Legionella pneumophila]HAU9936501.1 hypothetical protein [Legionella pneumophila]HAU9939607.1 hypothetical protein [Legionella pneumophila]
MNKQQPFKLFFSPIVGLLLTLLLFGMAILFPLQMIIENSPKGASWIDLVTLYWVYFAFYNGYFLLKRIMSHFSKKSISQLD